MLDLKIFNFNKKHIILTLVISFFILLIAGLMAILIVFARIPTTNNFMSFFLLNDFKKFLVIHVNLSLYVWLNLIINIFFLFISLNIEKKKKNLIFYHILLVLSIFFFLLSLFKKDSFTYLSNYIPILNNLFFFLALLIFFSSILVNLFTILFSFLNFKNNKIINYNLKIFIIILSLFIINYFFVLVNFFFSYFELDNFKNNLDNLNYFELLFWNPGHCFQNINFFSLLLCLSLIEYRIRSLNFFLKLFVFLFFFSSFLNFLFFFFIKFNLIKIDCFLFNTYLMKMISFFFLLFFSFFFLFFFYFKKKQNIFFILNQFCIFFLFSLGCFLGLLIKNQNTIIPSHYHASLGAIALSYMFYFNIIYEKIFTINIFNFFNTFYKFQTFFFFIGQIIFVFGFFLSGKYGALRKSFVYSQEITNAMEFLGLKIMAIGGLFAILSGILFIFYFLFLKEKK